ncbi:MAG: retropepsin-like domain-containing protein [Gemmataceae bacterium]|nr:retropepsin-like domain-containing protein [Gemmataceae bacterium]
MPVINGPVTAYGAVAELLVGVHEARRDVLVRNNLPVPARQRVSAQIDTGTTFTAVAAHVLQHLQVKVIDRVEVITSSPSGEPKTFDRYAVSLGIEADGLEIHLPEVLVIECVFPTGDPIQALIGQDVLRHCLFVLNGPSNSFALGF